MNDVEMNAEADPRVRPSTLPVCDRSGMKRRERRIAAVLISFSYGSAPGWSHQQASCHGRISSSTACFCYDPDMKIRTALSAAAGLVLAAVAGVTGFRQSGGVELNVGDNAPAFNVRGSDGRDHTLAEHKGKRAVVLAWFPKAFTGG